MFEVNGINFSNFYTVPDITTNSGTGDNIEHTADETSDDTVLDYNNEIPIYKGNELIYTLSDYNKNGVYEIIEDYPDKDDMYRYYAYFDDKTGELQSYKFFENYMPELVYIVTKDENDEYSVEISDSRTPFLKFVQQIRDAIIGPQEFDQSFLNEKAKELQDTQYKYSSSEYEEKFEEPEETEDEAGNKTKNKLEDKIEDESKEHQIK